jgi:hypothetical protein
VAGTTVRTPRSASRSLCPTVEDRGRPAGQTTRTVDRQQTRARKPVPALRSAEVLRRWCGQAFLDRPVLTVKIFRCRCQGHARARLARTNLAWAWQRRLLARPEGGAVLGDHLLVGKSLKASVQPQVLLWRPEDGRPCRHLRRKYAFCMIYRTFAVAMIARLSAARGCAGGQGGGP